MKCFMYALTTLLTVIMCAPSAALAVTTSAPAMATPSGLSLLELKVTGDEFIMLQNNSASAIADLSDYWLTVYNNVNPRASGVSSASQQLPSASLQAHQTMVLSANPMATCGASLAGKLSLSLTDSGGYLQLTQSSVTATGAMMQTSTDFVSWSSGSTSGIIQNMPSSSKDPRAVYYRYLNGSSYAWQPADLDGTNNCQLNLVVAGGSGSSSAVTPLTLAATSPPATILGIDTGMDLSGSIIDMPGADSGLLAPQISELLPNPLGTGNDANDEFVELYNSNDVPFDLSGFSLQVGVSKIYSYTFPSGTMLNANSFHAFYAATTKLSQSNTSGQATLLDPIGRVLSMTAAYTSAKDGYAWALANGTWYWTVRPTPNAANIILQPSSVAASKNSAKKPSTRTTQTKKSTSKTKKAAKHQAATKKKATAKTKLASAHAADAPANASAPVHVWILALIGVAALLYGAYEYRRDLANRLFQLASHFNARRANRRASQRGRSD